MKTYDSAFLIGKSHQELATPCQDYALCFNTLKGPVAIVADGCSQAGNTDLGARVWALAAQQVITENPDVVLSPDSLRQTVLEKSRLVLDQIPYSDGFSTLLVCASYEDTTHVHVFGDGVVVLQHADGSYEAREYGYSPNAPFYLNYLRNSSEWGIWQNHLSAGGATEEVTLLSPDLELISILQKNHLAQSHCGHYFSVPSSDLLKIVISTDGVCSFLDPKFNVNFLGALKEISQFKSTTGEFVHRRLAALSRKIAKNQFSAHFDDLAVACIVFNEEKQNG